MGGSLSVRRLTSAVTHLPLLSPVMGSWDLNLLAVGTDDLEREIRVGGAEHRVLLLVCVIGLAGAGDFVIGPGPDAMEVWTVGRAVQGKARPVLPDPLQSDSLPPHDRLKRKLGSGHVIDEKRPAQSVSHLSRLNHFEGWPTFDFAVALTRALFNGKLLVAARAPSKRVQPSGDVLGVRYTAGITQTPWPMIREKAKAALMAAPFDALRLRPLQTISLRGNRASKAPVVQASITGDLFRGYHGRTVQCYCSRCNPKI